MKPTLMFNSLRLLVVFLALTSTALASNTWYVDGVNGSDKNDCKTPQTACQTIGHAISLASSGDSIIVAPATYAENLVIGVSLKLIGSGTATTIIDGGGASTVVTISGGVVLLSKVTIRNGHATDGGGIYNAGTLTISNSTLSGNSASYQGGGVLNSGKLTINQSTFSENGAAYGAAIRNFKGLTINTSTFSGNSALYYGGGILNSGKLTINRSTFSGNSAGDSGGGIANYKGLTINTSTFIGNSALYLGGGIYTVKKHPSAVINNSTLSGNSAGDYGGGIFKSGGTATLQNSIVANNSEGNCAGTGTITSNGYNLSSDGSCNFNNTGDLNNTYPKLGMLGNHGGPTQTIPLLSGSPAIDAGNPNGCTDGKGNLLTIDQRGKPRPDKEDTGGCDMGAYERQKD